jgi:DNA polymerase III alpha subunit
MKKDIEQALILSGAFDYCEPNRYKLLNHYMIDIRKEKKCKILGKEVNLPIDEKDWKRKEKLALEKEYMGSYISEHPLDPFPYQPFDSCKENEMINTSGIVTSITMKSTKTGKTYMELKFTGKDDVERKANLFDEKRSEELKGILKKNQIVIIKGKVSLRYNNINAQTIQPVAFRKQSVETEDIQVEDKTHEKKEVAPLVVNDVPNFSIF